MATLTYFSHSRAAAPLFRNTAGWKGVNTVLESAALKKHRRNWLTALLLQTTSIIISQHYFGFLPLKCILFIFSLAVLIVDVLPVCVFVCSSLPHSAGIIAADWTLLSDYTDSSSTVSNFNKTQITPRHINSKTHGSAAHDTDTGAHVHTQNLVSRYSSYCSTKFFDRIFWIVVQPNVFCSFNRCFKRSSQQRDARHSKNK